MLERILWLVFTLFIVEWPLFSWWVAEGHQMSCVQAWLSSLRPLRIFRSRCSLSRNWLLDSSLIDTLSLVLHVFQDGLILIFLNDCTLIPLLAVWLAAFSSCLFLFFSLGWWAITIWILKDIALWTSCCLFSFLAYFWVSLSLQSMRL